MLGVEHSNSLERRQRVRWRGRPTFAAIDRSQHHAVAGVPIGFNPAANDPAVQFVRKIDATQSRLDRRGRTPPMGTTVASGENDAPIADNPTDSVAREMDVVQFGIIRHVGRRAGGLSGNTTRPTCRDPQHGDQNRSRHASSIGFKVRRCGHTMALPLVASRRRSKFRADATMLAAGRFGLS